VRRITDLLVQILKPIPPIAWIPIVILWFGIGEEGKTFLIFLGGFFTILVNVVDGIRQIDPKLIEASKAAEVPFLKYVVFGVIPGAAPGIFTGLRLGISSCWMCVVAAELISASSGLGFMIMNARQFGQTEYVLIGMLVIGIIGKVMDSLLKLLERRVVVWM
jgi:sulfonate transport system permease protein